MCQGRSRKRHEHLNHTQNSKLTHIEFYLARPFNFNLSPLTADGLDLRMDRSFTFSSSACDFLKGNNFDFGKVFTGGIPYLSRDEETSLRTLETSRLAKQSSIPDVVIPTNEPTTLEFYRSARSKISSWVNDKKDNKPDYCNITAKDDRQSLNGYQRRLVHQLVRNEFPKYRAFGRMDGKFMQIELLDQKREDRFQQQLLGRFKAKINRQKGLRWIFEALCGGDLSEIEAEWFWDRNAVDAESALVALKAELASIVANLKTKKHIIIGHNLFTDLGFLYATFIGPLPSKVQHFQEDIHELFPTVIDTKYLATEGQDSMSVKKNLKDLLAPFKKLHFPFILLHEDHTAYGSSFGKEHEAGYDSWMTAELFVKLSAQLYREHKLKNGLPVPRAPTPPPPDSPSLMSFSSDEDEDETPTSGGGAPLFSSNNPFDILRSSTSTPTTPSTPAKTNGKTHSGKKDINPFVRGGIKPGMVAPKMNENEPDIVESEQFIPGMDNDFWTPYVNKLRLNGTDTGVCDLAEIATPEFVEAVEELSVDDSEDND